MKLVNIHKLSLVLLVFLLLEQKSNGQQWSLNQCIDTAQVLNKNLKIASNNISLSAQKAKEAKANLLPKIMANAEYKYFTDLPYQLMPLSTFNPAAEEGQFKEAQFGVPHNINANLQLALPIYNPQIYGGIEASKIATEMNLLKYEKSMEQVVFEITNLYYNAQILKAQVEFLDKNLLNAKNLLDNLKLLNQQLLATQTDVDKIALQVAQLETKKSTVDSKYMQLLNALKFAIGIPYDSTFEIDPTINYTEKTNYNLVASLETRLAKAKHKLLKSELKTLNHSRFLPNVNLIGSYGTSGFGYDQKPNTFLNFYPIGFAGLNISYPNFNGTVSLRKVSQKRIELSNSELSISLAEEQNEMEITNAKLQRKITYEAINTSNQQITLAHNIYNNTVLQQQQGIATLTEVLLADNALREAQQVNLSAIVDFLKADLELKRLTGNIK